jgi:CBS domain-containing protein
MNPEVFHVPTTAPLSEVARKMVSHKIHRVLVTDAKKGQVVGIISSMGILAAISA